VDNVSRRRRSEIMSRVRAKDTAPEMLVRRLVYSMGYRYRLHDRSLPGTPDLVFRKTRQLIFVHGCFWHRHAGCALARWPKSRQEFWLEKLEGNRTRDRKNIGRLRRAGWKAMVVWECQLSKPVRLEQRIRGFLDA
jgi:DNA mismatch endonuclease (patch repair protein)